jgi:hypothetical protein
LATRRAPGSPQAERPLSREEGVSGDRLGAGEHDDTGASPAHAVCRQRRPDRTERYGALVLLGCYRARDRIAAASLVGWRHGREYLAVAEGSGVRVPASALKVPAHSRITRPGPQAQRSIAIVLVASSSRRSTGGRAGSVPIRVGPESNHRYGDLRPQPDRNHAGRSARQMSFVLKGHLVWLAAGGARQVGATAPLDRQKPPRHASATTQRTRGRSLESLTRRSRCYRIALGDQEFRERRRDCVRCQAGASSMASRMVKAGVPLFRIAAPTRLGLGPPGRRAVSDDTWR